MLLIKKLSICFVVFRTGYETSSKVIKTFVISERCLIVPCPAPKL
jgi:hypothetical protein